MSDLSPQAKRPISPLVVVAVFLVVGIGGYVGYTQYHAQRFLSLMRSADASYRKGDFAEAVAYSSQAVAVSSTDRESRAANSFLARSLLSRSEGDDTQNGVAILKDITASPRIDDQLKARVYNGFGGLYRIAGDNENLTQLVFDTPPYNAYLTQAGGDVREATLLLLKDSNALNPTPFANFRTAVILAEKLHEQGVNVESSEQLKVAAVIRELVAAGDSLLDATGTSTMPKIREVHLYRNRSIAFGTISLYFPETEHRIIDESYERTIALMEALDAESNFTQEQRLRFLLHYAAVRSARAGSAGDERIKSILQDFVDSASGLPSVGQDVLDMQERPATNFMRRQISVLAEMSPEFSDYLKHIGWRS